MGKYYLGTGNQQINFQVVDSTGVINDLNLSGLYLSITGKAADADKLDNYDSSFFRNIGNLTGVYTGAISGKASDSELLDGLDSSYFLNGANITGTVALSGTFTGYYTGAFSGTITHTDSITFHTGLGINPDPAELTWSDDVGTMQLGLQGGNVDLRVGLQNYEYVTNRTASTISKGSVIYVSGAQGNRPSISLALGAADTTSANTFGLAAENIASMADGYVITNGLLTNLNTTGFAEGAALYLSPTISGEITSTKPQAPQHSVLVGFCVRSHASAGEILVKIQNGLEIDELHDVRILNKQNNDIIRYHAPSGVWYNSDTLAINGTGANYISGDLGIGTSGPTAKLHILGADKRQIIASTTDNAALVLGQWDGATNRIESSTRKLLITSYASGISLGINGSENVHVSTSGYLGVGTTSPTQKLDVSGSALISTNLYVGGTNPGDQLSITNLGQNIVRPNGSILLRAGGSQDVRGGILLQNNAGVTIDGGSDFADGVEIKGGGGNVKITQGDLGVGTTSPTAKLNVHKAFTGSGLYEAKTFSITTDNGSSNWTLGQIVGYVAAGASNSTSGFPGGLMFKTKAADSNAGESGVATRMVINAAGNVGINTTDPSYKLQVYSGTDEYAIAWSRQSCKVWAFGTDTAGTYINNRTDSVLPIYIKNSGNVGIGTTSPEYKLDIQGGSIRVLDNAGPVINLSDNSTRNWDIGLNATTDAFYIRDAVAAVTRMTINTSGSTTFDGELTLIGSKLAFTDDGTNINATVTSRRLQLVATGSSVVTGYNTDFYFSNETSVAKYNGNVGIGTTSPNENLEVGGNISIRTYSGTYGSLRFGTTNASYLNSWAGIDSDWEGTGVNVGNLRFYTAYGTRSEKMRITSAGNVGIGTTSPTSKLYVSGDIAANVDNSLGVKLNRSATNVWNGIGYSTANSTKWFVGLRESGDDNLRWYNYTNTSEKMVLTEAGSLGIGTTTPYDKLEVAGGIAATGYTTGNASQAHATLIGVNGGTSYLQAVDWGAEYKPLVIEGKTISLQTGTGSTSSRFYIDNSGNVGIGTTSPTAQLEIGGTNPEIRLGPAGTGSGAYMSYNTAGNYFSLNAVTQGVGYRKLVFANDGGNVLVGTTIDGGQKLQVNGTAYVSGSLQTADDFRVQATTKAYTWFKDATPSKAWGIGSNGWAGLSGGDGSMIFGVYTGSGWYKALELTNGTASNATFAGNVTVGGDLIINGTTTTVNSTVTTIDDPIITLGGDTAPTTDDNKDRGVEFKWHNGSAAKVGFFGFDDSTGYFTFIPDATNSSEVFSGTAGTIAAYFYGTADQAFTNQHNGNASQWYGRILSRNSTSDKAAFLGTYGGSVAGVFAHNNALDAWTDLYVNTTDGSTGGTVKMPSTVLVNGNQVLHAGNYNSYALPLTGGTLTGPITESSTTDQAVTLNATDNSWKYIGFSWSGTRKAYFGINASGSPEWGSDVANTTFAIVGSGSSLTIAGNTVWHAGNDGSGSGLDADLLDGYNQDTANTANTVVRRNASGNFSAGTITANSFALDGGFTISNSGAYGQTSNWLGMTGHGIYTTGTTYMDLDGAASTYEIRGYNNDTFAKFENTGTANTSRQISFLTNGGNFGIGTNSPAAKLEVNGTSGDGSPTFRVTSTAAGSTFNWAGSLMNSSLGSSRNYILLIGQAESTKNSGYIGFNHSGTSGSNSNFLTFGLYSNDNILNVTGAGKVGIGVTAPDAKLEVSGEISIRGSNYLYFGQSSNSVSSWVSRLYGSGGFQYFNANGFIFNNEGYGASEYMRITTTGNVGIGTTSPNSKLDIAYEGSFDTTTPGTGKYGLHFSGQATSNYATGITFTGGNAVASSAQAGIYVQGSGSYGTRMYFATTDDYGAGAKTRMMINSAGNVGIGTISPSYKLEVNGSFAATGITVAKSSGISTITFPAGFNDPGYIQHEESTNNNGRMRFSVGDDNDDNDYFSFGNTSSGFVERLRISANGRLLLNYGMWHQSLDGYNRFNFTSNGRTYFGSQDGYEWRSAADSALMVLTNGGNVGIGLTTPSEKLHIAGTVRIDGTTNGLRIFKDGGAAVTSTLYLANSGNTRAYNWQLNSSGDGLDFFTYDGSAWAYKITYLANGNVGIGTQAPSYKLEVNGSFAATTKSFVIPHPTKEGKKLRYGSLEGPENGVYVRGKTTSKVIELPDYWTKLVDLESITVQLTPIGSHQKLYVEKIENNKVYIANENLLAKNINCFFYILAERADVEKLQVEIDA